VKGPFDAVVVLNVLPVDEALPLARKWTKAGGVFVIDDAVRVAPSKKYADAPTLDEAAAWIERCDGGGVDRIERVHVESRSEILRRERTLYRRLERHAHELIKAMPRRARVIRECLAWQREAMGELAGPIRPACWLVRRGR
jgi:ferric-dicitrate binding protein FerR (iron transport regulator)